ncbi:MAG: ABC transporter substrate-binding protein [Gordonia sp. (in: high G+C Gram-positive bacteria)]|uniref:taurine ABC transporter substrate-binding protein n=1 Tax=Gordonia sp. (in: high G+C Gram-positive bacteria) TaxID=84139 RepID=UPI0039E2C292
MSPRTTSPRTTHTRRGLRRSVASTLLALVGVLAVATGCSVGAAEDSSKPTIRIAYQTLVSGDLIVKNDRWLEDALPGYNIKWTKFDSGADVNTAFVAKELDFGTLGSSPVARGLSDPLRIPYQVAFPLTVLGDNEALVARPGTGIETLADLRGKRIATAFASTAHYSLLAALGDVGLDASSVKLVDLQPQASLAAWQRGDVDAVYTWLPTLAELRAAGGKQLISSRALAERGKATADLAVVSTEFARQHPDAVDAWRKAQARAVNLIRSDPDAAAAAIAGQAGVSKEEAADQLKQAVFLTPAEIASPRWLGTQDAPGDLARILASTAEFLRAQNQIPSVPDARVFADGLYTKGLPGVFADVD